MGKFDLGKNLICFFSKNLISRPEAVNYFQNCSWISNLILRERLYYVETRSIEPSGN